MTAIAPREVEAPGSASRGFPQQGLAEPVNHPSRRLEMGVRQARYDEPASAQIRHLPAIYHPVERDTDLLQQLPLKPPIGRHVIRIDLWKVRTVGEQRELWEDVGEEVVVVVVS